MECKLFLPTVHDWTYMNVLKLSQMNLKIAMKNYYDSNEKIMKGNNVTI